MFMSTFLEFNKKFPPNLRKKNHLSSRLRIILSMPIFDPNYQYLLINLLNHESSFRQWLLLDILYGSQNLQNARLWPGFEHSVAKLGRVPQ